MNARSELVLTVIALWLAIAVVLLFALSGCQVPLRDETGFALVLR